MTTKKKTLNRPWVYSFFAITGMVLGLSGCGQDRNLTDYRNSQVELELAKYRSVEGTYRGLAYQSGAKKPLAEIEVQLFASTVVDSDGLRREPRAVLTSYVTLRSPTLGEIVVQLNSGYFLPAESFVKVSSNVTPRSATSGGGAATPGETKTLQLEGSLKGQSIDGVLSVFGYPVTALDIDVTRGAEWPQLAKEEYGADKFPYVTLKDKIKYTGKAIFADGSRNPTEKATLELSNSNVGATNTLLDVLSPVRSFTGVIHILDSTLYFTFSPMTWDTEARSLVGVNNRGGVESVVVRVECASSETERTQDWTCSYTSTMGGFLREFQFTRKK